MDQGRQAGMQTIPLGALSGKLPSAENPRGGQPPSDPAANEFQRAIASLKDLSKVLELMPMQTRPEDSVDIAELTTKIQRMAIERQTDMLKTAQDNMALGTQNKWPNVNAMGAGVTS